MYSNRCIYVIKLGRDFFFLFFLFFFGLENLGRIMMSMMNLELDLDPHPNKSLMHWRGPNSDGPN